MSYKPRKLDQILYYLLSKNKSIDNLIYTLSGKKAISDTIRFKLRVYTRKLRSISDFNPIIIGGCPRSGTTLARALIGMHPKIRSPQRECNILLSFDFIEKLAENLELTKEEINNIKKRSKERIQYIEQVIKLYLKKGEKQIIALKHPYHIIMIDKLFYHFPNMKFIHLIRDGRDVACSLRNFPKRKIVKGKIVPNDVINPIDMGIRKWVSCINRGGKWQTSKNYIEIKYEDLINDSVNTMKKIFDFLSLEMIDEGKLLNFYKYEQDHKHIQNIEVGMPIYKRAIGRWKTDMNKSEIKTFKKMANDKLIEYGYEKDFDW